jgi:phospholipase/carboxylesterase
MISRRRLLGLASSALSFRLINRANVEAAQGSGHLSVTPKLPRQQSAPGEQALGLGGGSGRDGLLIVPASYRPDTPAPLVVLMHGAGGSARRVSSLFGVADELGIIVLAPESRDRTWDAIRGSFGPDIDFLNHALAHAFDRCAVDRRRLAIGGFSDGASYGLSVGLASGDLFTHIVACSPGFVIPGPTRGKPRIFISHGTADQILPIDTTSRRLVPELKRAGYDGTDREFDGPHTVPPAIGREALAWFAGTKPRLQ